VTLFATYSTAKLEKQSPFRSCRFGGNERFGGKINARKINNPKLEIDKV
jgi:hypothetical protein